MPEEFENCSKQNAFIRPEGGSTGNYLIEFMNEVLGLVRSWLAYYNLIDLTSHILVENTWKLDFTSWLVDLPLFFSAAKIWKHRELEAEKHTYNLWCTAASLN